MFFLDSEHVGMGKPPPSPPQKNSCLFMSDAWFQKIILLGMIFMLQLLLVMYPKFTYKKLHNFFGLIY